MNKNRLYIKVYVLFVTIFVLISGCTDNTIKHNDKSDKLTSDAQKAANYLSVPPGFPPIPFPADNPYSLEKAELGRRLFYERILTRDSSIASCSHCHKQQFAFSDNTMISLGMKKEPETRNTKVISNVAYRPIIAWDGRGTRIEPPIYADLFLPQFFFSDTNEILKRLEGHPLYPSLFKKAFGPNARPHAYLIANAIATFVRTLVSGNSRYDKYKNGDSTVLNNGEKRGMNLFFSDRARCSVCHSGFLFTDGKFHNTGVTTHYFDRGRYDITLKNEDWSKFLTPSLRNVEVTAPYMHNGELKNLQLVLEHYSRGGRPFFNKDTIMRPLNLSQTEISDIISFLKTLTDWEFLKDPRFSKPSDMP